MMLTTVTGISPAIADTPARTRSGVGIAMATGSFCALAHAAR
ncbi:hypothetical protein [Microbacterium sp.]